MTTIYVAVPLESVEQAEALPVGTIAVSSDHQECAEAEDFGPVTPAVRSKRYEPECPWYSAWDGAIPATDVVGWTALVPIEAEEGADTIETGEGHFYTRIRYVTPWEEA